MWIPLRPAHPSIGPARTLLHWASQLVAAPGTTWLEARDDFGHTNLGWDPQVRALTGRPLDEADTRAALDTVSLEVGVVREGAWLSRLAIEGNDLSSSLHELEEALRAQGIDKSGELMLPTHDMPAHPVAEGQAFAVGEHGPALQQLQDWIANAHHLLTRFARRTPHASEVRLWPHHFDIATLVSLEPGADPEHAKSVNVGASGGDGSYAEPYLYVSPWPCPEPRSSEHALGGGHWHAEGFYAAVFTHSELVPDDSDQAGVGQGQRAQVFVAHAQAACRRMLGYDAGPIRSPQLSWFKAADLDEMGDDRVKSVSLQHTGVCLTRHKGCYAALTDKCPHQGGPLGEGSIERGWLRCPWHGWDFDPLTGQSPEGLDDGLTSYALEVRDDGVYVGLESEAPHTRTASDVMAETMVAWGVKWVFGMVGHSNLGLADALRRRVDAGELGYIGIRHEGAAAFATSAYGKLTGRPAACLAIAGPGATNLLTGLWDAHVDRAPALALTGQVQTQFLGRGAFQEIDLKAAFGGVANFTANVLPDSNHAELMNLACKHALLERGVSHLIFPDEVQTKPAGDAGAGSPQGRMPNLTVSPAAQSVEAALLALRGAKRPAIIVGHGARFAMNEVRAFAQSFGIPVITTFKAKGQISDRHPLGSGVLGRSGTPVASWFMNEADVLLVLGSSFSNHTGITSYKTIIQVDFEASALGRRHPVTVPVLGEIGVTLQQLSAGLTQGATQAFADMRAEVAERWKIWRAEKQKRLADNHGAGINSAAIFDAMSRLVPADAVIAVDVGNNTYSFGRYFEAQAHSVLMSGYLGSIGFALPAAMGAWVATQEQGSTHFGRKVVSVSGDGGLGQYLAELTTLAKYNMDITHVLLNNGQLGKISKEQRVGGWDVWETSLHNPDFSKLARNCGVKGIQVQTVAQLDSALSTALAHPGPALVEICSDALLF